MEGHPAGSAGSKGPRNANWSAGIREQTYPRAQSTTGADDAGGKDCVGRLVLG